MYDRDFPDYRETKFGCETCGHRLFQIWPSNLLTCTNWACNNYEPLFLVVRDD